MGGLTRDGTAEPVSRDRTIHAMRNLFALSVTMPYRVLGFDAAALQVTPDLEHYERVHNRWGLTLFLRLFLVRKMIDRCGALARYSIDSW